MVLLSVIARVLFVLFLLSAGVTVLLLMGYAWSFEIGGILISGHSPARAVGLATGLGTAWLALRMRTRRAPAVVAIETGLQTNDRVQEEGLTRAMRWWLIAVVCVLLAGATQFTLVLRRTPHVAPIADAAAMEIGVLQATTFSRTLGAYSRFGWNHPGPLYFYLLAPGYVLSARHFIGINLNMLMINLACLSMVAWIAARHRRMSLGIGVGLTLTLYVWRTDALLVNAWNPNAILWPTAATLMLGASAARGSGAALTGLVLAASFIAQTHIAALPFAFVATAVASMAWLADWPLRSRRDNWRWLTMAGAVSVGAWLLPAYDEWTREPGNLTLILRFFAHDGGGPTQDVGLSAHVWAQVLTAPLRTAIHNTGSGVMTATSSEAVIWMAAAELAALALGARLLWTRDRLIAWLGVLCFIGSLVALLSIVKIRGDITDYAVLWISTIGAMNAAAILSSVGALIAASASRPSSVRPSSVRPSSVRPLHHAAPAWQSTSTPLTLVAVLSLPIVTAAGIGIGGLMRERAAAVEAGGRSQIGDLSDTLANALVRVRAARTRVEIDAGVWGEAAGIVLQLHKRGVRVGVDAEHVIMFDGLAYRGDRDYEVWIVHRRLGDLLLARDGGCLLTNRHHVSIFLPPASVKRGVCDLLLPSAPVE